MKHEQKVRITIDKGFPYKAFNLNGFPFYWTVMITCSTGKEDEYSLVLTPYKLKRTDETSGGDRTREIKVKKPKTTKEQEQAIDALLLQFGIKDNRKELRSFIKSRMVDEKWHEVAKLMRDDIEERYVRKYGKWNENDELSR